MRAALVAAGHPVRRGSLPDVRHGNGRVMHCDAIDEAHRLVIEYDGAYWHAKREERDRMKTVRMLEAGWRVIRIRHCHPSYPLHSLGIEHPDYIEVTDPGAGAGQDIGFMPHLLWAIDQLTQSQPMLV